MSRDTTATPSTEIDPAARVEIRVHGEVSARTVDSLCTAIETHVTAGWSDMTINLDAVKVCDVVGIASLLQATERAAQRGARLTMVASPALESALLKAELLDELPLGAAPRDEPRLVVDVPAPGTPSPAPTLLARARRVGLRTPGWDELGLFERWANDPLLDQMVGSELLYHCRNVGAYHPDFAAAVLADPTSLTLLIQSLDGDSEPFGFVRLYGIRLAQQFGFLETAVASVHSLRKGWGIEASRLFVAYALEALRLHRIEAKVYAYNVLSANSLKRNGFRHEGVLRQARMYQGQRWDIHVFSILTDEMLAERATEPFPSMSLWSTPC